MGHLLDKEYVESVISRYDLLQRISDKGGFEDVGVHHCPYCYELFANGIKPNVFSTVLSEARGDTREEIDK